MDIPPQTTTTTTPTPNDGIPNNPTTTTILKRKRTKRQRPTTNLTHSSTSYNPSNSSPPSYSTTTEDEDTANCLILLSKGHNNIIHSPIENFSDSCYKFNSKRYIQTSTDTTTGTYVYECKTCSRTFPSFQALGGHRASHTKPRFIESDKPTPVFSDGEDTSTNNKKSSSKLCSICGAEFNSGQALGGHMRRHRATNGNTNTNTTLSLIPYGVVDDNIYDDEKSKSKADGLCLDLDLNLPAPVETTGIRVVSNQDQHRESSFIFSANQNKQQPSGYLSAAPTLVDCYY
ncbi:putative transcription factor C2H2 family [Helianthus annuus]|uniref:Putative zinc finger, C2H2-like protein n=1 Tax=Helianthus annuus TaxID=4232 RepID=A0A251SKV9_HELAN|nr:zinc finger protein ZAT5 [Helianthus annuus]KAF5770644.1 putative transcription factor C2H2 family [Helianthus annuus]KAJ0465531.1 putative transcription factor C2H2 family [Helianthus annuus]KAJ0470372.1 putative transcription factor C2H2 family [Helianthus annuus]KAJ0487124.1 putative transcription factor C2H2 family [Helianthus annuus]KAJ0661246.1 putative transcription factor C2H2 family [Helianthus annuus]